MTLSTGSGYGTYDLLQSNLGAADYVIKASFECPHFIKLIWQTCQQPVMEFEQIYPRQHSFGSWVLMFLALWQIQCSPLIHSALTSMLVHTSSWGDKSDSAVAGCPFLCSTSRIVMDHQSSVTPNFVSGSFLQHLNTEIKCWNWGGKKNSENTGWESKIMCCKKLVHSGTLQTQWHILGCRFDSFKTTK